MIRRHAILSGKGLAFSLLALTLAGLAACSGGGDDDAPAPASDAAADASNPPAPTSKPPSNAAAREPIGFIGHGALFDAQGREVAASLSFLREAQAWYRGMLLAAANATDRARFETLERELADGLALEPQAQLLLNARLLDWLLDHAQVAEPDRLRGKFMLMQQSLQFSLDEGESLVSRAERRPYRVPEALQQRLQTSAVLNAPPKEQPQLVTADGGAAYRALCNSHGVPLPPDFGPGSAWVSKGTIAGMNLFLARELDAEVLTYESASPPGLCVALPRYDARNTVLADGVICLGQSDPLGGGAKACFWDNQKNGTPFNFPRASSQPISRWGGGTELRAGIGGVCTDCHAGENPYIVHGSVLGSLGVRSRAPTRHEPIVRSAEGARAWPENPGPMNSPPSCSYCHGSAAARGVAGRLPHVSTALGGYCNVVLRPSLGAGLLPPAGSAARTLRRPPPSMPADASLGTMACTPNLPSTDPWYRPCGAGLTASCTPGVNPTDAAAANPDYIACTPEASALLAWCGMAATGDASTRGDPHVTAFGGVRYDFQAAGEFVYLRNGSNVEVQLRQTPVATAAPVGPDPHTGLTSCASVNTAMAARIGSSRISYQPASRGQGEPTVMELRIDGKPVPLPDGALKVGGGRITRAALGSGIEIDFPDSTHLSVVPGFWGAPNNIWYLNVDVTRSSAREGIAGAILGGQWLPLLPNGTPLGPRPASLAQRHFDLNQKFANAWRVTPRNSLFDYTAGTSTATFTQLGWPPERPPCEIKGSTVPPAQPLALDRAKKICSVVDDKDVNAQCVVDVAATGHAGFADTYRITQALRRKNALAK